MTMSKYDYKNNKFLEHYACTAKSAYINWIYLNVSGDAECRAVPPIFGPVAQETLVRRAVHLSFWLGSSGDTISLLAQMLDLL
jgi:hypothetical protein